MKIQQQFILILRRLQIEFKRLSKQSHDQENHVFEVFSRSSISHTLRQTNSSRISSWLCLHSTIIIIGNRRRIRISHINSRPLLQDKPTFLTRTRRRSRRKADRDNRTNRGDRVRRRYQHSRRIRNNACYIFGLWLDFIS